jgi:hypothetical protein
VCPRFFLRGIPTTNPKLQALLEISMSDQSSKDRAGLCVYTFEDGRQCNMPRTNNGLNLCYFHERRERQRLNAQSIGIHVSRLLKSGVHTGCDLHAAFTMLFRGAALGLIPPESLGHFTRLGRLLVETHILARDEVQISFDREWPDWVRASSTFQPKDTSAFSDSELTPKFTLPPKPQEELEEDEDDDPEEDEEVDDDDSDQDDPDEDDSDPQEEVEEEDEEEQEEEEEDEAEPPQRKPVRPAAAAAPATTIAQLNPDDDTVPDSFLTRQQPLTPRQLRALLRQYRNRNARNYLLDQ